MELLKHEEDVTFNRVGEGRKSWIEKQNIEIRDRLQPPLCASSLSTLTGLSIGSRVSRTCQMVRMGRSGLSSRRATPSLILQHGYDWITDEDQRILNAMVKRREAQMEEEDLSLSARNIWEKDRLAYNKMMNEKLRHRSEYLQEKRRLEKAELERRKENISQAIKCQQIELEDRINQRHALSEFRQKDMFAKRRQMRGDVDEDELCHRLRREQVHQDEEIRSSLHVNEVTEKEKRAERNLKAIKEQRNRKMKEHCVMRERKMEAVQQLRQALDQRFEEWCEDSTRVLNSKLCLCEYRAAKANESKRKMLQDRNQLKRLHHLHAINLLREEDHVREIQARQEMHKKELRMKYLLDRKEQNKVRSRKNALTTASLRQQIKDSYQLHN